MNELGLPIYKVVLSEDDEMDFNAFVDYPATKKGAFFFGKNQPKQHFNDEKRIVTGVAIATNVPIYRRGQDGQEYRLFFTKEVVRELGRRMMERGYMHNVNSMHDSNKQIKGVTLEEIYYTDKERGHHAPDIFKGQNLQDGTMIVSYHVKDNKEWAKWKSGEYQGFSIEAWFDLQKVNFNNQINMKKEEKSFLEHIKSFFTTENVETKEVENMEEEEEKTFAETITASGETMKWEGDLATGTPVFLITEESDIVASEGVYSLPEMNLLVTVDANGLVESVEEVTEEEFTEVEQAVEQMAKQFQSQKTEVAELKSEIAELNKKIENLFKTVTDNKKETKPTNTNTKSALSGLLKN